MTPLRRIVPSTIASYNVVARVSFVSLGGINNQGEHMINAEIIDGTTAQPMKLFVLGLGNVNAIRRLQTDDVIKLRNISSSIIAGETVLVADANSELLMTILNYRAPECRAVPAAPPPLVVSITKAREQQVTVANLLVRVDETRWDALSVTDHTGCQGRILLHEQVRGLPLAPNTYLCLSRVMHHNDQLTLRPSGAVEEVSPHLFRGQGLDMAANSAAEDGQQG